ncbi:MAG: aminoglycoside phosphotransferase family protein [Actinomycetota bacterium]|nr:aminoglycoside phosphotransferase family protein [Actinomycetota bacterium]
MSSDVLADWCVQWLGVAPAVELFEAGFLSTVTGLRLRDGREIVIKVRPNMSRLAGCAAVHRALWRAGFPCPAPLVDLQPIGELAVSAEVLVAIENQPPVEDLAVHSAAALARLIALAPQSTSVPSLAPSPSWTGWDHGEPDLWPTSEELDVDLNAYDEPRWFARVASALRDSLRASAGTLVIGHGDWHPENLRWRDACLTAVFDWDSAICQPEPAIVGLASVSFRGVDNPAAMATVDDSADFIAAYQHARRCTWTAHEEAMSWAAGLWQRVVDAKVHSLGGTAEEGVTRDEAAVRLNRAGLSAGLVDEPEAI